MSKFVIKIDARKHAWLLDERRKDPGTGELLKAGDQVYVCRKCKVVSSVDVWLMHKGCCPSCQNETTLKEIPVSIGNQIWVSQAKKRASKYKTWFYWTIPIIIISINLGVYFYFKLSESEKNISYERNENRTLTYENDRLKQDKNRLERESNRLNSENKDLRQENQILIDSVTYLNDEFSNLELTAGVGYWERSKYNVNSSVHNGKIYFKTLRPIKLNSVKVYVENPGYLVAKIYEKSTSKIIAETNREYAKKGGKLVEFNCILEPGNYYIIQTGKVELQYITNFSKYPVNSNNILQITGTEYDENFYVDFFDWRYNVIP